MGERRWGCSSVGRASDRHAADTFDPPVQQEIFSQSQLSVQTLLQCPYPPPPPRANTCIDICAHVKDLVVHVRVRWIMETLKHLACTLIWVARLCRSWLFPGKRNPNFPLEKSHWDNKVVRKKKVTYTPVITSQSRDTVKVCDLIICGQYDVGTGLSLDYTLLVPDRTRGVDF